SLYAIGGGTATVEAYDPATDTWTTKAPLPTMRSYTGAAEVGGIIYVVGGFDSTGNILADLLAYDPTTDTWTAKAPMPTARDRLAVGVVDGILYAAGGEAPHPPWNLATLEAYDPGSDHWWTRPSMPTPRDLLGAASLGGALYAIGGFSNHPDLSAVAVEAYNPPPSANECAFPPAGTIWCDDFEINHLSGYYEVGSPTPPNTFTRTAGAGWGGSYGMRAVYTPGAPDAGDLKLVFGNNPVSNRACCSTYREIYWRAYLRNEAGWTGGGGNAFASAMVLASPSW